MANDCCLSRLSVICAGIAIELAVATPATDRTPVLEVRPLWTWTFGVPWPAVALVEVVAELRGVDGIGVAITFAFGLLQLLVLLNDFASPFCSVLQLFAPTLGDAFLFDELGCKMFRRGRGDWGITPKVVGGGGSI